VGRTAVKEELYLNPENPLSHALRSWYLSTLPAP
jgi:hypothetical protein